MPEENFAKEPTLEEYGLDASVYKNYLKKIETLNKLKDSLKPSPLVKYLASIAIYFLLVLLIFLLLRLLFKPDFWTNAILSFSGSILLIFSLSDYDAITNLLTLGKYKAVIKQIDELWEDTSKRVRPFEEVYRRYYENMLKQFFTNNLYRKHSGTEKYGQSLSQLSEMVDGAKEINTIFLTTKISTDSYLAELFSRQWQHSLQSKKGRGGSSSFTKIAKNLHERQEVTELIPPEVFYNTPRKINWDELNRNRKMTGLKGEEIVLGIEKDYLESVGKKDLATKVRNVAVELGDGLGYDILSFFEDGREKYVEVKSTKSSFNSPFYLSRNELEFLKNHQSGAYIYRILITDDKNENTVPELKAYTANEVLNSEQIIPVEYMVRMS